MSLNNQTSQLARKACEDSDYTVVIAVVHWFTVVLITYSQLHSSYPGFTAVAVEVVAQYWLCAPWRAIGSLGTLVGTTGGVLEWNGIMGDQPCRIHKPRLHRMFEPVPDPD